MPFGRRNAMSVAAPSMVGKIVAFGYAREALDKPNSDSPAVAHERFATAENRVGLTKLPASSRDHRKPAAAAPLATMAGLLVNLVCKSNEARRSQRRFIRRSLRPAASPPR